jgi:RimJ/RimL family protein N-acetyltransferase
MEPDAATTPDPPQQAGDVLVTPRLRLRHVVAADAPFLLELLNEPGWLRYIGDRGVRSLDDARRYVADGPQRMYATHGLGLYLVERLADHAPLGLCGLIRRDALPDVDLGFALAERYQGQGYAYEAAAATLQYAWDRLHLPRVVAIVMPGNATSRRLLERLGMAVEGTVRLAPDAAELLLYGASATTR